MIQLPPEFHGKNRPQLFENLSGDSLQRLLQHSLIQRHPPNQLLVQQGDEPTQAYLVLEGTVKTFRIDKSGNEAVIRMLQPGDTCMEAVLFMGGPSPISVQTLDEALLLVIPDKIIKSSVQNDGQFAMNILRIVTRHYKNAMHQIDAANCKSPLQRIGYYFLMKHIDEGHEQLNFKLPFKKQMIANYLGMTPETFSRALKQMKTIGIEVANDTITLRDAFALCSFCDTDTKGLCPYEGKQLCKANPTSQFEDSI